MEYYTSLVALWGGGFSKKFLHLYCWKNCKINKKDTERTFRQTIFCPDLLFKTEAVRQ